MSRVLGIDLGTTNTCVAVAEHAQDRTAAVSGVGTLRGLAHHHPHQNGHHHARQADHEEGQSPARAARLAGQRAHLPLQRPRTDHASSHRGFELGQSTKKHVRSLLEADATDPAYGHRARIETQPAARHRKCDRHHV